MMVNACDSGKFKLALAASVVLLSSVHQPQTQDQQSGLLSVHMLWCRIFSGSEGAGAGSKGETRNGRRQ
jgi:hypothetical protein